MDAVSAQSLTFTYPQEDAPILSDVNLTIPVGSFTLLFGRTGSGKTTLLRHLVPSLAPHGTRLGDVMIADGSDLAPIGFVQQDPDNQIVTDTVFHELAFALENQGLSTTTIRRRVAENASYFGLEYLLESSTHTLSGGQKQILNLAAAMVADPSILVLDEPTAELDPIAAQNFLRHLRRVNTELGTTILCCEHRLDDTLALSDQVLLLHDVREAVHQQVQTFTSQEFVTYCADSKKLAIFLPEPTQIAVACSGHGDITWPLDVRSGRRWLSVYLASRQTITPCSLQDLNALGNNQLIAACEAEIVIPERSEGSCVRQQSASLNISSSKSVAVILRDVCFQYGKHEPFVLKHLSAQFEQGAIHGIVGGNASGKSTLLGVICGLLKSQLGQVCIAKDLSLAALPQDPKASFVCDTVRDDLLSVNSATIEIVQQMARQFNIAHLLARHPFDLSGGEAQKLALAKILLLDPDILLLDEPTKGLDAQAKQEIGDMFTDLACQGKTLIIVTHDLPFAARYTQSCSLLANGEIITRDQTQDFFTGNSFYTTPTSRMSRKIVDGCTTPEQLIDAVYEGMLHDLKDPSTRCARSGMGGDGNPRKNSTTG
ncbi:MAG: ABC transporter ATP-binding protein [Coriobacteriia bacterium]|nr:ABC transporter ATP-binding protein [Coriobacteriia bacterium]